MVLADPHNCNHAPAAHHRRPDLLRPGDGRLDHQLAEYAPRCHRPCAQPASSRCHVGVEQVGVYEAGDHVKVSISAAGAIQLHARGALIKTTADGVAAGYDWYGIVALWTSGSWVDNVQLTYPQSPGEASWSSFAGAAGVRMPTEAPGARTCGTQYAGWLSTPHPAAGEPPTPGVVCFDADRGAAYKDCYLSAQVEVCACAVDGGATTYLYRLPRPPRCYAAYCGAFESGPSPPPPPTSPTPSCTAFDFAGKNLAIWNLGGRGHSCTTSGGDCLVTSGATGPGSCNCDVWDPPGGAAATIPPGGAPRAVSSDPPILRIKDVGITSSTMNAPGQSFDLIISNMTDYEPWSFQWTWVNGEFLEINLNGPRNDGDPPTTTTLQFCAVLSDTSYEDFVAGQRLVLDEFPLTVYDLCALARARWARYV